MKRLCVTLLCSALLCDAWLAGCWLCCVLFLSRHCNAAGRSNAISRADDAATRVTHLSGCMHDTTRDETRRRKAQTRQDSHTSEDRVRDAHCQQGGTWQSQAELG